MAREIRCARRCCTGLPATSRASVLAWPGTAIWAARHGPRKRSWPVMTKPRWPVSRSITSRSSWLAATSTSWECLARGCLKRATGPPDGGPGSGSWPGRSPPPRSPAGTRSPCRAAGGCRPAGGACGHLPSWRRRSRAAPFFGGLDALAVQHHRAGGGMAALPQALLLAQPGKDLFPQPLLPPQAPVVVDGLPGWKVVRQQPPGTAGAQPVQHGIDQLTAVVDRGAATRLGRGDKRRQQRPLWIGEVGRVAATRGRHLDAPCRPRNTTPQPTPFSDTL